MRIRRFGLVQQTPVPRPGVRDVTSTVIQLPTSVVAQIVAETSRAEETLPLAVDAAIDVVALSIAPDGEIDEHDAPFPILCMVIAGSGFVRLGGPMGETAQITAGDAVLWPEGVLHKLWTTDVALDTIVIHYH